MAGAGRYAPINARPLTSRLRGCLDDLKGLQHNSDSHRHDQRIDGHFADGPLAGRSVNVKFHPKLEGLLDIRPDGVPDYYLVLTGPRSLAMFSRGQTRPLSIQAVFLLEGAAVVEEEYARDLRSVLGKDVERARAMLARLLGDIVLRPDGDGVVAELRAEVTKAAGFETTGAGSPILLVTRSYTRYSPRAHEDRFPSCRVFFDSV